jgi:hypothetical protein
MVAYWLRYDSWRLGICVWTSPHPHGSHFSFVIGRYRTESGESHLAFVGLDAHVSMTWLLFIAHRSIKITEHRPGDTSHHYPQHYNSSSSARQHIDHDINHFSNVTAPSAIPHITIPAHFPSSQQHHELHGRPAMANNVHYDVQRIARCSMSRTCRKNERPMSLSQRLD